MISAAEVATDLVDTFRENIDGDPAVEAASMFVRDGSFAALEVTFTDGSNFIINVERVDA